MKKEIKKKREAWRERERERERERIWDFKKQSKKIGDRGGWDKEGN